MYSRVLKEVIVFKKKSAIERRDERDCRSRKFHLGAFYKNNCRTLKSDIYVPNCRIDLSFNSMVILVFSCYDTEHFWIEIKDNLV